MCQAEHLTLAAQHRAIEISEMAHREPRAASEILHERPEIAEARNRWEKAERGLAGVQFRIEKDRHDRPFRSTLQLGRVSYQEGSQILQISYKQAIERAEAERSQAETVYRKALEVPNCQAYAKFLATQETEKVQQARDGHGKATISWRSLAIQSQQMRQVEIDLAPVQRKFERQVGGPRHGIEWG